MSERHVIDTDEKDGERLCEAQRPPAFDHGENDRFASAQSLGQESVNAAVVEREQVLKIVTKRVEEATSRIEEG